MAGYWGGNLAENDEISKFDEIFSSFFKH